jgi:hypothetical protein
MGRPVTYRIKVRGWLGAEWSGWFDDWSITVENSEHRAVTVLTGPVIDQAALFGLLWRIRDLGLPLLLVQCEKEQQNGQRKGSGTTWDSTRADTRMLRGRSRYLAQGGAMMSEKMIAVCGLDCGACDIYKASLGDVEAAQNLAGWWKGMGWLKEDEGVEEVLARGPHCLGCRGDRDKHWSAECAFLTCCVDQKGLTSCHECDDFVCERLEERLQNPPPGQGAKYQEALDRLRAMRAKMSK